MGAAERMYAEALFQAVESAGAVSDVRGQLSALAEAIDGTPELAGFLSNPQLDPGAKADVLSQLCEGAVPALANFVRLVASRGRAGQLRAMAHELEAIVDRAQGRMAVELTTAYELSEDEATAIVRQIETASGRKVDATRNVDPELIGGMVLQAGSLRVDASVRGRLEGLRRELVRGR